MGELKMRMSDFAQCMAPGTKLYISIDVEVDKNGNRKWYGPLTDAQILAYWNHIIGPTHYEANGEVYCIIYSHAGGNHNDKLQTVAEPASA